MGTTSSHHGPYAQGYTHATMAGTMGRQSASWSQPHQSRPQLELQAEPACMNAESLVTAGQHTAVNTFPGLVHTARHVMEAEND